MGAHASLYVKKTYKYVILYFHASLFVVIDARPKPGLYCQKLWGTRLKSPACAETLASALLKQASPGQQRLCQLGGIHRITKSDTCHTTFKAKNAPDNLHVNGPSLSWKKTDANLQSQSPWKRFTSWNKINDFHFSKGLLWKNPDLLCTPPWTCLSPNWPENCWDIDMRKESFTLLISSHYLHLCLWKQVRKEDFPLQELVGAGFDL